MRAEVLGENGLFRRTLAQRAPKDFHILLDIRRKIHIGTKTAMKQAFEILESSQTSSANVKGQLARLYEQICRNSQDKTLAVTSKQRAVSLYKEAGQIHRAAYLEMLLH